jgi:hypothetical protein
VSTLNDPMNTPPTSSSAPRGCYGLRVRGLDAAASLLVKAPPAWPPLTVECTVDDGAGPTTDQVGEERARICLRTGGWIGLERRPARAVFHLAVPRGAAELVHPYLAPAAALMARWLGRDAFHAGAVAIGEGAWCVIGPKGSGKSTTMAWLARRGHPVLCDDLAVVEDGAVLAGPRCLDLRADTAARLGGATPLGVIGARERWRLALGAVPPAMPLHGWFVLTWGEELAVEPVPAADRLSLLAAQRTLALEPARASDFLALGALPMLQLRRPPGWDSLPAAVERLLAAAG